MHQNLNRTKSVEALACTYSAIWTHFARSSCSTLRLVPIASGMNVGPWKQSIIDMTIDAITDSFNLLSEHVLASIISKAPVHFCIFDRKLAPEWTLKVASAAVARNWPTYVERSVVAGCNASSLSRQDAGSARTSNSTTHGDENFGQTKADTGFSTNVHKGRLSSPSSRCTYSRGRKVPYAEVYEESSCTFAKSDLFDDQDDGRNGNLHRCLICRPGRHR